MVTNLAETLDAFMQKLRPFMELHESFGPILVAGCEDDAAEVPNNGRLRRLERGLPPLRAVFDEHRGALEGRRSGSAPSDAEARRRVPVAELRDLASHARQQRLVRRSANDLVDPPCEPLHHVLLHAA